MNRTFEMVLEESKAEPEIFMTVDREKKRVQIWDEAEYYRERNLKGFQKRKTEDHREAFYYFHQGFISRYWANSANGIQCDLIIRNGVIIAQRVVDLQAELAAMRTALAERMGK